MFFVKLFVLKTQFQSRAIFGQEQEWGGSVQAIFAELGLVSGVLRQGLAKDHFISNKKNIPTASTAMLLFIIIGI